MPKSLPFAAARNCVVVLLLAGVSAGPSHAERLDGGPGELIVNGVATQSRPTTGALLAASGSNYAQICSGTLIGCRTFLTAAHCVCPGDGFCLPTPNDFSVYLQHAGVLDVDAVDVHPSYQFSVTNDIAVITLSNPVEGIVPTPINTTGDPPHGTPGVIAGFGIIDGFSGQAGILREGQVTTASCAFAPEPAHVCWDYTSPIGAPGLDSNTCSGDSGGPLFADLGGDEVIVGVTSGGSAFDCRPQDSSFDVNVFRNVAFIQSVGGADLLSTSCGSISQIGDVATTIITSSASPLGKDVRKCRREIRNQYRKYTAIALKAEAACIDGVGKGSGAGPCPDATALAKINKARVHVDPARIGRKCLTGVTPEIGASGDCTGASSAADLANCIVAAGDAATASMLSVSYADDAPAGPIAVASCQRAISKAMVKYQKASLKAFNKCEDTLDSAKVGGCPDDKTTSSLVKLAEKATFTIASTCSDDEIASLDAAGGFGATCAGSLTTAGLSACELTEYDGTSSDLLALLDHALPSGLLAFTVPTGSDRFRATVNGIEEGGNDLDLFVRFGAPATASVYDASSVNGGVFDGLEITSPAAGTWHLFVDEFSGHDIAAQITVTIFSP